MSLLEDVLLLPPLFPQGIGDSAQGFANAVLFVCFTKAVRDAFLRSIACKSCRKPAGLYQKKPLHTAPFADPLTASDIT